MKRQPERSAPVQVDNTAYMAMLNRMITAAAKRAGEGDPNDLQALNTLVKFTTAALHEAVRQQRAAGQTWQDIGDALGTTRQAALMRFGS